MKISVFITSYNQKTYLKEAIDSALAQTLAPAQIVVVDDCSSDGSQDLINDYVTEYPGLFTPIYHKKNTGVAQVRIDALNAVTGDYVTYMDGDDRFLPEKLDYESNALKNNPDCKIACSNNFYISQDARTRLRRWVDDEEVPQGDVFWQTFARAFPKHSLFRMELVEYESWKTIGFHDPSLSIYEDFDMRIRLTKWLKLVYVDEPLSEIRTHGNGLSKSPLTIHFNFLDQIYRKNKHLLNDLTPEQKLKTNRLFGRWLGTIGIKAVSFGLVSGQTKEFMQNLRPALRYRLGWQ